MKIENNRRVLIHELHGRKHNLSKKQFNKADHLLMLHEEFVIKQANLAIDILEKDYPLMEAKLKVYEDIMKYLNGKFLIAANPSKTTKTNIVKEAEKIDVDELLSLFQTSPNVQFDPPKNEQEPDGGTTEDQY